MSLTYESMALQPATVITVVERIVAACQPLNIIAFGSRARGDALVDSDLDLLVVMPAPVSNHFIFCSTMRGHLDDLPLSKDILVTDPEHFAEHSSRINSVYHDAAEEGLYLWRDGELNLVTVERVCRYTPELV